MDILNKIITDPDMLCWVAGEVKSPSFQPERDAKINQHTIPLPVADSNSRLFYDRHCGATPETAAFFKQIQSGKVPEYCLKVIGRLPPPPKELETFMTLAATRPALADAHAYLFADDIITPADAIAPFISGSSHRSLQFRSPLCSSFFSCIFHHMQHNAPVEVELEGWDLYHGHVFMNACPDPELNNLKLDMGILFHAKEFPREYRKAQWAPLLPIAHPDMNVYI